MSRVLRELGYTPLDGGPRPVVVIPNHLDESAQDDILHSAELRGLDIRLLWRPVAAALQWIETFALVPSNARPEKGGVKGKVVALHLGIDGFECDLLDIVSARTTRVERWVPARKRPQPLTAQWLGVELIERLAEACLAGQKTSDLPSAWKLAWASPWPLWARAVLVGEASVPVVVERATRLGLDGALIEGLRASWDQMAASLDTLVDNFASGRAGLLREFRERRGICGGEVGFRQWVSHARRRVAENAGEILGCVVTGAFAPFPVEGSTLALVLLKKLLGQVPGSTLVEGSTPGNADLVAKGAAIYAARLDAGITGYYDTLPRLQVLTVKMGQPQWSDLLKEDDQFVEGGKLFQPPDREGYFIRSNEDNVVLQVVLGEHPTVKSLESKLPRRAKSKQSIRLQVSMEPARGRAKVRIVPHDPTFLEGHPSIFLDWKTSTDTKLTPQEALKDVPRICPALEPRQHSPDLWRKMVPEFEAYTVTLRTSRSQQDILRVLDEAKRKLQRRDSRMKRDEGIYATAVSSDGGVDSHGDVLRSFLDGVASRLRYGGVDRGPALRVLAYGSADHEELLKFLSKNMDSPVLIENHNAGVFACGECLRDPQEIADFVDRFHQKLIEAQRKGQRGLNEWLKALAKILMYRERACEQLPTHRCLLLTEHFLGVFGSQLHARKCSYIFRHSALCIVFLLRRRIFDDGYLLPESKLANEVKAAFREAKTRAEQRSIQIMGGTVNLPEILERLIDYIDERGRGTISEGLLSEGGDEDE